jgi:uncharacterized protein (TIGR02611 family)
VTKPQWAHRYTNSWASMPTPIRRILAASVGMVTLLVGVALLVLPGPGLVVMLLGLAILATEFTWAKHSMHRVKHHGNRITRGVTRRKKSGTETRDTDQDRTTLNDEASDK